MNIHKRAGIAGQKQLLKKQMAPRSLVDGVQANDRTAVQTRFSTRVQLAKSLTIDGGVTSRSVTDSVTLPENRV
jgi:hypothetical protein